MAVSHDTSTESHTTGTTGSVSEASFTWSHGGSASAKGVLVFVFGLSSATIDVTSVTYGGVTVPAVSGGEAADTTTEPGFCKAFFLGSGVPTGTQNVVVNRNNNTNKLYAIAATQLCSVGMDLEVYTAGMWVQNDNGAYQQRGVDDGSPGTNSLRYFGLYSGAANVLAAGADSTALPSFDPGANYASAYVETVAGQGVRQVGSATATADDQASIGLAIREVAAVAAYSLDCQPASFALTGTLAGPVAGRTINAAPTSYTLTGTAATVPAGRAVNAAPGSYALTGSQAQTPATFLFDAAPGSYALTGSDATLARGLFMDAQPGSYAITGTDADFTVLVAYLLSADPGDFTLTGTAAGATADRLIPADPGVYSLTGADVAFLTTRVISADPGSYTITGATADLTNIISYVLGAEPGAFVLAGTDSGLIATFLFPADSGNYQLDGADTSPVADRAVSAAPGSFTLAGNDAAAVANYVVQANPGSYLFQGADAEFLTTRLVAAMPGDYTLSGVTANLVYGSTSFAAPVTGRVVTEAAFGRVLGGRTGKVVR